ncbi:MAG: RusA family crossover junction endodeoxyribonuclease [Candidatus Krumholzibacteria bacterium]|nr:RusA family crossover junction endodeoxyribonuclease [Candidatus Krumholzibacteria bacterium]
MRLELPWPPSVNRYWRSVAGRVLLSRQGRAYRAAVIALAGQEVAPEGRLACSIEAWPPDRRRRDLDNLPKAVIDALQHAGVMRDDELIDDLRIVRRSPVAGGRLVIELAPALPAGMR